MGSRRGWWHKGALQSSPLQACVCVCVCVLDRPTRWCLLTVYLLYYRKAPSRMLFHTFFYFLTA